MCYAAVMTSDYDSEYIPGYEEERDAEANKIFNKAEVARSVFAFWVLMIVWVIADFLN